jgi:hypothetical protein
MKSRARLLALGLLLMPAIPATAAEVVDPGSGGSTPPHGAPPAASSLNPQSSPDGPIPATPASPLPPSLALTATSADSDDLVAVPAAGIDGRAARRTVQLAALPGATFIDSDAGADDTLPASPTRKPPPIGRAEPVAIRPRQQLAQVELTIPQPVGGYQPPVEKAAAPVEDSLRLEIARSMAQIEAETAPRLVAGLVYRGRPGQAGLSQLDEIGIPIEARYSPWLTGAITVSLKPVYLTAGSVNAANLPLFGVNQFLSAAGQPQISPGQQDAGGLIASIGYGYRDFSAQIGEVAGGFPVTNITGNIAYQPKFLGDQLSMRIEALREPVTDSVLSYAGRSTSLAAANALATGAFGQRSTWGGVVKSGGRISMFYDDGDIGAYGAAGLAWLTGTNVPDNASVDSFVGAYFRPYKTVEDEIKVGINLTYFGYDRNLGYYSYGQGGYFSPRNFAAITFPVEYAGRSGRWSYLGAVALGFQHFNQRSSPFFPNNAFAQQALVNLVGSSGASYQGNVGSGLAANLRGQIEYAINSNLSVGAAGTYSNGRDYDEYIAKLYVRKAFAPPPVSGIIPPAPGGTP